ncbi:hypothetical protein ACGF5M_00905 [Gemmatimonadota bacterium]
MTWTWTDARDGKKWDISSAPIMEPDPASPVSERDYQVRFRQAGESLRLRVCRRAGWSVDDLSDGELRHLLDEAREE